MVMAQFRNTNRDYHPKWYANEKSLVFYSYRIENPGIYKIDINTGKETLITNKLGSHPNISPDGKKVVYCLRDQKGITKLTIIDAITGELINTIDHKNDEMNAFHPSWLSNDRILFNMEKRGESSIMVVNIDGTGLNAIIEGMEATTPYHYEGARKIVFAAKNKDNNFSIYKADINGKNIELLINDSSGSPHVSPDGSKIVYESGTSGIRQIYVMNIKSKKSKQLTNGSGNSYFPQWSPSGKKIAFANESYGFSEIVVMNADGSRQRNITRNSVEHGKPAPLSDGHFMYLSKEKGYGQLVISETRKAITSEQFNVQNFDVYPHSKYAYFTTSSEGNTKFYQLSMDNKETKEIISIKGDVLSLALSKDGQMIAYEVKTERKSDIHLLYIKSKKIATILTTENDEGNPSFHPTSKRLIYNSDAEGNYDLMSYDIDSEVSTKLVSSEKHEVSAAYSPDGNHIVFVTNGQNAWDIDMMDLVTKKRSNLTSLRNFEFFPRWTSSGKSVLFQSTSTGSTEVFELDINSKKINQLTKQ